MSDVVEELWADGAYPIALTIFRMKGDIEREKREIEEAQEKLASDARNLQSKKTQLAGLEAALPKLRELLTQEQLDSIPQ